MLADLIRAWPAAAAAGVLPGYFWVTALRPTAGLGERLAYSTALSMGTVPVVAVILARLAGTGITLWVAILSVAIIFVTGVLARWAMGAATGTADPLLPQPAALRDPRALILLGVGLLLALASTVDHRLPAAVLLVTAVILATAGIWAGLRPPAPRAAGPSQGERPWLREAALAGVLVLTAVRAYSPVIRFDWPLIPGGDQYSHAVMAEQMMWHGSYGNYLIYPPGFSALTAVICRFSGLSPLMLFPVLAPALLAVTTLGAYTLANRLWGWRYGIAAAVLSGLVLDGAYNGFEQARYPDLVSAYFLLVMTVVALVSLFDSPTARSGTLVTVLGASVMMYHSVATQYLVLLLVLVGIVALVYLLLRGERRAAGVLTVTLAATAVLAAGYAAYIYDLPKLLSGHSATSTAISIAVGSQSAPGPFGVLTELSPPVVWLGLLGVALLAAGLRHLGRPPQLLAALTVVIWCVLMYLGTRTAADGFPVRFERDLGAPLSVAGALGAGLLARSLAGRMSGRPAGRSIVAVATVTAAVLAGALVAVQVIRNAQQEATRGEGLVSHPVAAAGHWLRRHRQDGSIITTPYLNPGIPNRAMLALGGYTGLQAYLPRQIAHPRSLPTGGRKPLLDTQEVLLHPESCAAGAILKADNVRYVVLYQTGPDVDRPGFSSDPGRYHQVFENSQVIIYATRPGHDVGCES